MSDKNLLIQVDKASRAEIDRVAEELSRHGLKVQRKLPITGVISGLAAAERVEELRGVKGVSAVREEETISLPPMDENTPQ